MIEYLRGRSLLLVLDNCEHVLAPAARLVAEIAAAVPAGHRAGHQPGGARRRRRAAVAGAAAAGGRRDRTVRAAGAGGVARLPAGRGRRRRGGRDLRPARRPAAGHRAGRGPDAGDEPDGGRAAAGGRPAARRRARPGRPPPEPGRGHRLVLPAGCRSPSSGCSGACRCSPAAPICAAVLRVADPASGRGRRARPADPAGRPLDGGGRARGAQPVPAAGDPAGLRAIANRGRRTSTSSWPVGTPGTTSSWPSGLRQGVQGPDERAWVDEALADYDNLRAAFVQLLADREPRPGRAAGGGRARAGVPARRVRVRQGGPSGCWTTRTPTTRGTSPWSASPPAGPGTAASSTWPAPWPRGRRAGCPPPGTARIAYPGDVLADVALYEGDVDVALRHYTAEAQRARDRRRPDPAGLDALLRGGVPGGAPRTGARDRRRAGEPGGGGVDGQPDRAVHGPLRARPGAARSPSPTGRWRCSTRPPSWPRECATSGGRGSP